MRLALPSILDKPRSVHLICLATTAPGILTIALHRAPRHGNSSPAAGPGAGNLAARGKVGLSVPSHASGPTERKGVSQAASCSLPSPTWRSTMAVRSASPSAKVSKPSGSSLPDCGASIVVVVPLPGLKSRYDSITSRAAWAPAARDTVRSNAPFNRCQGLTATPDALLFANDAHSHLSG
jgi:hypothetical protein